MEKRWFLRGLDRNRGLSPRVLICLLITVALFIANIAGGQEAFVEESVRYRKTVSPEDVSISNPEAINNGYVIAYGNYISPPYLVSMDDEGKIYINGVQYEPREVSEYMKSISKGLVEGPDEYTVAQHQLNVLIHSEYKTLSAEYEKPDVLDILLDFVRTQAIIKDAYLDDYGNLVVIYTDDSTEVIFLSNEEIEVSKSENMGQREKLKRIVISELQAGALLVFGFRATLILPAADADRVIKQINEIQREFMSKEEKIEQLRKNVIDKELAKEIYYNYQPTGFK